MRRKKDLAKYEDDEILKLNDIDTIFENISRDVNSLRNYIDELFKSHWNIWQPKEMDIEKFKEEVEEFAKENPDAKISVWAFVYDSEKDKKPNIWKFKRE